MQSSINKKSERRAAYLFVIPAVILLLAFLVYPALQTVRYAFTDYNIMRPDRIRFCGFNNFIELFQDENFWIAVKNTLYFTIVVVPSDAFGVGTCTLDLFKKEGCCNFQSSIFQSSGYFHGSSGNSLDCNV